MELKELTKPAGILLNTTNISINKTKEDLKNEYITLSKHEKIDYSLRSEIDICKAYHYLNNLEFRTEATLIKMQQKDEDTKTVENTLNRIMFIKYQIEKQDSDIIKLKREVDTLTQKLAYFNTQLR